MPINNNIQSDSAFGVLIVCHYFEDDQLHEFILPTLLIPSILWVRRPIARKKKFILRACFLDTGLTCLDLVLSKLALACIAANVSDCSEHSGFVFGLGNYMAYLGLVVMDIKFYRLLK
uniref:Uncharacterized protein n=1 Tax=Rhizophora mucronata TaxID=61149 RepID=A0A2P2N0K2_RHIMU